MPRLPMDYSKSIIYKICCKDINVKEVYVGSTTNFDKRKCSHKNRCNNSNDKSYNLNVYKFIRDNGGWDNFDMVMIEEYKCNDKLELHARERYYLEQLGATLNMCIPSRTKKEYDEKNKEKIKEYQKEYQKTDKHKEYKKEYDEKREEKAKLDKIKCELCNKIMRKDSLTRHNKRLHNKI